MSIMLTDYHPTFRLPMSFESQAEKQSHYRSSLQTPRLRFRCSPNTALNAVEPTPSFFDAHCPDPHGPEHAFRQERRLPRHRSLCAPSQPLHRFLNPRPQALDNLPVSPPTNSLASVLLDLKRCDTAAPSFDSVRNVLAAPAKVDT